MISKVVLKKERRIQSVEGAVEMNKRSLITASLFRSYSYIHHLFESILLYSLISVSIFTILYIIELELFRYR